MGLEDIFFRNLFLFKTDEFNKCFWSSGISAEPPDNQEKTNRPLSHIIHH